VGTVVASLLFGLCHFVIRHRLTRFEWAWNIAYNAILSAGRTLMFSKGYRPMVDGRHITVWEFLEYFLKADDIAV
jgi:hypothetical protein